MKNLDSSDVRRARKSLQASFLFPLPAIRNNPKKNKRLAPFHLSSRFPAGAGTTTHLIEEVPQYDYLGLRRDEKLTTSPAKEAVLAKVNKALIPVFAAMGSLKYLKRHHNPSLTSSPITPLQLWKVSVLPHYLPCLRYFHNPSHLDDLQHDLNRSLSRTLQVYGTYEVFLAETGTRPLYTEQAQSAQLRYHLLSGNDNTIPHLSFKAWSTKYWSLATPASLERGMHAAVCSLDNPRSDLTCPMPPEDLAALAPKRERSYNCFLQKKSS